MKSNLIIALLAAGFSLANIFAFLSNGALTTLLLSLLWGFLAFRNIKKFLQNK